MFIFEVLCHLFYMELWAFLYFRDQILDMCFANIFFSPLACLNFLTKILEKWMLLILISNLSFCFMACVFCVCILSKNLCQIYSPRFSHVFFQKFYSLIFYIQFYDSFWVTFCVWVWGTGQGLVFLHMDIRFSSTTYLKTVLLHWDTLEICQS